MPTRKSLYKAYSRRYGVILRYGVRDITHTFGAIA
jgi:hypothetical protein